MLRWSGQVRLSREFLSRWNVNSSVYPTDGFSLRDLKKRYNDVDTIRFNRKMTAAGTTGLTRPAAAIETSGANAPTFRIVEFVGAAQG
jgi:hypothetical protein